MTLHWWMHWFWVTALLLAHASSVNSFAWPQPEELQQVTPTPERRARAMYYSKPPATLNITSPPTPTHQQLETNTTTPTITTTHWTPVVPINTTSEDDYLTQTADIGNTTETDVDNSNTANVTVIPVIEIQNVTANGTRKNNLTRQEFVKDESGVREAPESKIVTEKPLSLETSILHTRIPPKEVYRRTTGESGAGGGDGGGGGLDVGAVFGLAFGALGLGALCASSAFVLYRRRYLNKPHALHDKCSNPDSSGYLDDSTVRDNSEEMYSLDNDSFLNSLEAMTIQNYWTDTVKHTKL